MINESNLLFAQYWCCFELQFIDALLLSLLSVHLEPCTVLWLHVAVAAFVHCRKPRRESFF